MKDVPFRELVTCRQEDMGPGQIWGRMKQGENILELVTKAEGPARLIEAGPRKHT